jgi:uncharacterized protein with PQ loop repeat
MKHKTPTLFPKKRSGLIDNLVYVGAVVEPLMTIPQIYDVWVNDMPAGSLLTWASYFIFGVIWLLYALKYKLKPLIICEILWVSLQGLVVIGLIVKQ